MDRVIRAKRKRRKLFLRRVVVCFCLAAALVGLGEGARVAVDGIEKSIPATESRSGPVSSAAQAPPQDSAPLSSGTITGALSPGNAPSSGKSAGWFDDAVFIGDSRTEGLENYDGLGNATYYAIKGLMVNTAYTKPDLTVNGKKETVMQAVENGKFGKVYIMLGINELGWSSMQSFVDGYAKVVADVKKDQPQAKIYLQSILPVSEKKSATDAIYNNKKIGEYNRAIQNIAKGKGVTYLDVGAALADSSGALPENASTDGIHLNAAYCGKWCDFLKAHTGE